MSVPAAAPTTTPTPAPAAPAQPTTAPNAAATSTPPPAAAGTPAAAAAAGTPLTGTPPAADPQAAAPAAGSEAKPPEAAKPVVPDKYDLKLPQGSLIKPERLEELASFAKEHGLTQEQAQAQVNRESAVQSSWIEAQKTEAKQRVEGWMKTASADPEIGGAGFKENADLTMKVVARFGSPDFMKALDESGLGNHPELVRFVSRIGKAMAPDQLVHGGNAATREPIEDRWYPKKKEN